MGVKPDHWIRRMAIEARMIEPFEARLIGGGVVSFGLSSYGYDLRLSEEFRVFDAESGALPGILDPKSFDPSLGREHRGSILDLPPGSHALGRSIEYLRIPRGVVTVGFGKSTYSRCGLLVSVTPFEPEWEGHVTIAILNPGRRPVRVYANEGIAQILFLEADEPCEVSYADRKGKYQATQGIAPPKV